MERTPSEPSQSVVLAQLAHALRDIRDSWVKISLALTDLVTETPSTERDEVMTEVERYLSRLRLSDRRDFD
jgi:hypothetical protein